MPDTGTETSDHREYHYIPSHVLHPHSYSSNAFFTTPSPLIHVGHSGEMLLLVMFVLRLLVQ